MPIFSNGHEKNFFEPQKNFLNASHFCQQKFFAFSKKISAKAPLPARQKKERAKVCLHKNFRTAKILASQTATPKATKKACKKSHFRMVKMAD